MTTMRELSIFFTNVPSYAYALGIFATHDTAAATAKRGEDKDLRECHRKVLAGEKTVKSFYVVGNETTNIRLESSGLENSNFVDYFR